MATQKLVFNFLRTFWNFPKLTSRTCELCKTHWTSVEHKRTISTLLHAKYLRSREACGGTSTRSFFLNSKRDAHKIDKREQFKEVKAQLVSLELSLKEDDSDVGKKALADKEKFMQEAVDEVNALKIYDILPHDPPDPSVLTKRPPVVTIMGHVDHGKTTLLDYLRKTSTVHKEFGGITQHIGAFSVKLPSGERITFLDTPGHAAFRVMRQRGANVTDIVILVVAADDGVKDQTVESIKYAKEAGVPIIVAINKTDKHTADIERTMQMLAQHDILVEELGGEIQAVPISALKGSNILALEEAIIALAEVMDIKADPIGKVEGHIIESRTDLGRGKLATILVTRGTLKKGDLVIAGTGHGRVRTMFDDLGKMITKARPGTAVEVIGWKELPSAGDFLLQAKSEKEIKDALLYRNRAKRLDKSLEMVQSTIEAHAKQKMFSKEKHKIKVENVQLNLHRISYSYDDPTKEAFDGPEYNILVKGDVNGSVEAILHMIDTYDSKLCQLNVVHYGVGPVTEADLELARTFNGEIFAFNLKTTASIARYAKALDISIHNFNVIYRMFDAIKNNINKKLPIGTKEVSFGEAVVQKIFQMKDGKRRVAVAGCVCIKGTLKKQHRVKVVRNGQTILTSTVMSMKHHKKNLDEIRQDMECGICLTDNSIPLQENDQLVFFELEEHQATVRWDPGF